LEYQNADGQVRSALNVATSCTNLVMFGAVTRDMFTNLCTCVKKLQ